MTDLNELFERTKQNEREEIERIEKEAKQLSSNLSIISDERILFESKKDSCI